MLTGAVKSSSPPDAIGTWQPVPLKGTGTPRRLSRGHLGPLVPRSLTSFMKERETQAAASWRLVERRANETLKRSRFEKPKLRSLPAKVGVGHVWLLVNLRSDQIRWKHRVGAQCFKLESLILAQNERWRQA